MACRRCAFSAPESTNPPIPTSRPPCASMSRNRLKRVALQFRWFPFVGANNYSPLHARQRHFATLNHLKRNATTMTVHPFAWPNPRAIIPLQAITGPTPYHNRVPVINGHQHLYLSASKSLTGHKRTTVPDRSNRSSPLGHRVRHNAPCSRHGESEHKTKRVSSGRRAENRREPGQPQSFVRYRYRQRTAPHRNNLIACTPSTNFNQQGATLSPAHPFHPDHPSKSRRSYAVEPQPPSSFPRKNSLPRA